MDVSGSGRGTERAMRVHLRRATLAVRHRHDTSQVLLLLLGIALTGVGLIAVAMQARVS